MITALLACAILAPALAVLAAVAPHAAGYARAVRTPEHLDP